MNDFREIPANDDPSVVAKWIWRNLVPKSGQATSGQGELLRAVEKLRWESQNNGNVNWDDGFESFIAFLERTLIGEPKLSAEQKASATADLAILADFEHPYTEDDVYDRLEENVVAFCRIHSRIIERAIDPNLGR